MPLTPQQREFLDNYVNQKRTLLTRRGKKKRAKNFGSMRDKVQSALLTAPPGLLKLPELIQDMRRADSLAEQLKFNRASDAMEKVLRDLEEALRDHSPKPDPNGDQLAKPYEVEALETRLYLSLSGAQYKAPQVQLLAKDVDYSIKQMEAILGQKPVKQTDLLRAQGLVEVIEGKLARIIEHRNRINARKKKLEKYLGLAEARDDINSTDGFVNLQKEVKNLLAIEDWSSIEESTGTALHLKLMLALADGTGLQQKDIKRGKFEMVLAVRHKESSSGEPNYKMIVKPAKFEVAVSGFKPGGGATREAMGSFLGDELQRQLGFSLNVPETRVVTMEGRAMSGDSLEKEQGSDPKTNKKINKVFGETEQVVTSVQSFRDDCKSVSRLSNESPGRLEPGNSGVILGQKVAKQEIQQMAVFDLISLNMDRHDGNVMVTGDKKLVPIDHGNIMPTASGLRFRAMEIGPPHAVLPQSEAGQAMLSPELLERLELLDVGQLIASMQDQHEQMKLENDGIDVNDLNKGLDNVRRSAEFLKFAAKELTLAQIYSAYELLQDLIFFCKEEDKRTCFRRAVDEMKNQAQSRDLLGVFLGASPETPLSEGELRKRVTAELRKLGWFLEKSKTTARTLLQRLPARCLDILTKGETSGLSDSLEERYQQLGGRAAAVRLGYVTDDKSIPLPNGTGTITYRINALELHYAMTGRIPRAD